MQDANETSGPGSSDERGPADSDAPRFNELDEEALDLARLRECKRDIFALMWEPKE